MIQKIKQGLGIWKQMGSRYMWFRVTYEAKKKSGLLAAEFPLELPLPSGAPDWDLAQSRLDAWPWNSRETLSPPNPAFPFDPLRARAVLEGNVLLFNSLPHRFQSDQDWLRHPKTGFLYDAHTHWTRIPDMDPVAGDIKYVWERSRFHHLHPIMRLDRVTGEDHADWVLNEIQSWIQANPLNCGPNFRCSQEISLRVFNWLGALSFYRSSPRITEDVWKDILQSIYGQIHHVWKNIDFSRIAVRNNHAITECLALFVVGSLFPEFPQAAQWKKKGKAWFEEEVAYQVYPDGTFLQFSMNYHRVLVQLLTLAIRFSDKLGEPFSEVVYKRAEASLSFLRFFCREENGHLPNYGANDGALFFQLADQDYRDYRPQLFALETALSGKPSSWPAWGEEAAWFGYPARPHVLPAKPLPSAALFPAGGYAGLRDGDSLTFFRSGRHRDRPSQADNHHVDIWIGSDNMLRDGGSYLYNAPESDIRYFFGTRSHNTVMVEEADQMKKGQRFVWLGWSQSLGLSIKESDSGWILKGEIEAFLHLGRGIRHLRQVEKIRGKNEWAIRDTLSGKGEREIQLRWHPGPAFDQLLQMEVLDSVGNRLVADVQPGWFSSHYGRKEPSPVWIFRTQTSGFTTRIFPK
jgi:Heparinase II/III-like protein/Heparinase II/III N-terminus